MAFSVSQKLNLLLSLVYNRGHCKNCPHILLHLDTVKLKRLKIMDAKIEKKNGYTQVKLEIFVN